MVSKHHPATLCAKLSDIGVDEDAGCITVAFMARLRGLFDGMIPFAILDRAPLLPAALNVLTVEAREVIQRSLHDALKSI